MCYISRKPCDTGTFKNRQSYPPTPTTTYCGWGGIFPIYAPKYRFLTKSVYQSLLIVPICKIFAIYVVKCS